MLAWALLAAAVAADDRQDLQGLWVSLDEPWSVEFAGDTATFHGTNAFAQSYQGRLVDVKLRYTLKPETIPPEIDLNEADFEEAKKTHRAATFQRRFGIYILNGDELLLQFGARKHPEAFDYSEGAPANHAWPLSRKLRRVSPEERQAMEALQGIWKGEVRERARIVQVNAWSIRPGWILGLHGRKVRYRLYPDGDFTTFVLHQYQVEQGRGGGLFGLGGSYTNYFWKPYVGKFARKESAMCIEMNQVTGIENEKVESTLLHADGLPQDLRAQLPGEQKKILPLTCRLEKVSDDLTLWGTSNQAGVNLRPPTAEQLRGQWRTIMGRIATGDVTPNSKPSLTDAPPERWTFADANWRRQSEQEDVKFAIKHQEFQYWTLTNPSDPKQILGPLQLQYEPVTKLLWASYSYRDAEDRYVQRSYVLESLD
jgi:hypothetical protein